MFGQDEEAQITVMVMKNMTSPSTTTTTTTTTTSSSRGEGENMEIDNDAFWEGIKKVVMEKYVGQVNKEDVYASLRKGYEDKFKT